MLGTKKKEETLPVNEALLNVITPMGLEIKRNSLVIGENMGKVYGAVRYPQKVEMGWLSKITNIPSTIVSVGITPIDNSTLISALSKSIVQQRGAADSAKDPLTRQRAEKAAEDGEHIMQKIDQEGETVAMMSLTVMPVAQDEAAFSKICRRVEKTGAAEMIRKKTGLALSPYFPASKLAWLKENVEGAEALAKKHALCFGTIDTWLVYRMTHGTSYKTDYSNASRTQLFDIFEQRWDEEICQLFWTGCTGSGRSM